MSTTLTTTGASSLPESKRTGTLKVHTCHSRSYFTFMPFDTPSVCFPPAWFCANLALPRVHPHTPVLNFYAFYVRRVHVANASLVVVIVQRIRSWKVFQGRNNFYCDGRLMAGPDVRAYVVTVFLVLVPTVLFLVFP